MFASVNRSVVPRQKSGHWAGAFRLPRLTLRLIIDAVRRWGQRRLGRPVKPTIARGWVVGRGQSAGAQSTHAAPTPGSGARGVGVAANGAQRSMGSVAPKPYLSIAELAQVTPWTNQAIRTMISRGIFRRGVHYFAVRRRPVFKWSAIVAFIEGREVESANSIPMNRGGLLGADET